uniref:Meiosis-specific nuclear structural protein 1 n=1 Tax=Cacopsylla melanoneura TaxID=428564 RepID=A0A8D9A3F8_9HEMI
MFLSNPKGPKETMGSLFQSYGTQNQTEKVKNNQDQDNNGVTFQDIVEGDNLSEEMEKVKQEELRELRVREQICRDSPELTELNNKLHQAVLRNDYALQLEEKENQKLEQKLVDQVYRDQLCSATQKQMLQAEVAEQALAQRKADYRKALEQQMRDEVDAKKQDKYKQYLEEQKLTQAEIDRLSQQDKVVRDEKLRKMLSIRQDMQEAMSSREQKRQEEKIKNKELERTVESYWEQSSKHEQELKRDRQDKQRLITERQELCAQSLQEIMQRKQTRADLVDNITVMTQLTNQETADTRQDEAELEKRLRQTTMCSELDSQVAEKLRVKQQSKGKENSEAVTDKWIWGGVADGDQAATKLRKQREVAAYNRATMMEHELLRKQQRRGLVEQTEEEEIKQRLIEEEKERLFKLQNQLNNGV